MKSLFKDKILRTSILLLTVMTISIESKAQVLNIDRFLTSVVNILPESSNAEETPSVEITDERGYLDNGILIFKENLKVCKDIVSGSSVGTTTESQEIAPIEKCTNCSDTIASKKNTTTINVKKKRSKNFRNFPGNIRSRI